MLTWLLMQFVKPIHALDLSTFSPGEKGMEIATIAAMEIICALLKAEIETEFQEDCSNY